MREEFVFIVKVPGDERPETISVHLDWGSVLRFWDGAIWDSYNHVTPYVEIWDLRISNKKPQYTVGMKTETKLSLPAQYQRTDLG